MAFRRRSTSTVSYVVCIGMPQWPSKSTSYWNEGRQSREAVQGGKVVECDVEAGPEVHSRGLGLGSKIFIFQGSDSSLCCLSRMGTLVGERMGVIPAEWRRDHSMLPVAMIEDGDSTG
ncbi:predicted protein [Histoplasma capsulatum G186AR]|uniref:Uncharacterized protein n=1 Tax=Ajellomyces capsulatus (strain G186AR / H82 / ATCC MYA-2454 / RMSCC 2432) TaxID=447093 RepID=C0NDY6_AJECG|nr:uncharacterized protein HCBG_02079 [Histoplasma capsulatum G186AR]EEH10434.1 predicted protein [Histoplasma capsulatum G186AR]